MRFPLDPLWASSAIDVVGIDYYAPLADWRDGAAHLDRAIASSTYDPAYLAGNLRGGEAYDWYYADDAARGAQTRTPITDGLGKPWVFRVKDLWNWWANPHYERVGGVELGVADRLGAARQADLAHRDRLPGRRQGREPAETFPDPKSSEGGVPYFSDGRRDDLIQRRYLEAVLATFDPAYGATTDEQSGLDRSIGGRMIDAVRDPSVDLGRAALSGVSGGDRCVERRRELGDRPLAHRPARRRAARCADRGDPRPMPGYRDFDTPRSRESVDGYVIDRPMPPRAAIEPLALAYAFDAAEVGGTLAFRPRGGDAGRGDRARTICVLPDDAARRRGWCARRRPSCRARSRSAFTDGGADYRRSAVTSRRLVGGAARASQADLAVVTNDAAAERRADIWLQDLWAGRESAEFALPPSRLALAPGDVVGLTHRGRPPPDRTARDQPTPRARAVKAQSIDPGVFDLPLASPRRRYAEIRRRRSDRRRRWCSICRRCTADDPPVLLRLAVFANPWPGAVAVWRSATVRASSASATRARACRSWARRSTICRPGRRAAGIWSSRVRVQLYGGALASVVRHARCSADANAAAVQRPDGAWEVLQFANAELVGERTYRLSRFLRGQAGSEWAMGDPLPAGAPFVLLDRARSCRLRAASMRSAGRCSFASSRPAAIMAIPPRCRFQRRRQRPRCGRLRPCISQRRATGSGVALLVDPPHAASMAMRGTPLDVPLGEDERSLRARHPVRLDGGAHAHRQHAVRALRGGR